MQNKTTAKKKMAQRRWSGRKIGFIAIGLVLLASLALWGIQTIRHNRAVARERAQFMAAKADLHELAQQLAKEIGPPTASKEEQSCDYTNVAYGRGVLSCSVIEYSYLQSTTYEKYQRDFTIANALLSEYDSVSKLKVDTYDGTLALRGLSFVLNDFPSCGLLFYYNDDSEQVKYSKYTLTQYNLPVEKNSYIMELFCSSNALEPYYRIVDSAQ